MDTLYGPEYILRGFAWAVLKANITVDVGGTEVGISESQYGGLVPIVPLSEEPEINGYPGPHLVYGYNFNPARDIHVKRRGSMTFVIYENEFRRLSKIISTLQYAFEREDESARDVNNWSSRVPAFIGLRFGTITLNYVEGGTPEGDGSERQEGGNQSGIVSIAFEYYVDYDVETKALTIPGQ